MKPRLTFIINRKIRQRKNILRQIEQFFFDYPKIIVQTEYRYHAMLLAEQLAESSDFIISVGGDGTLNEVVNGLMFLPESQRDRLILGALPAGTGNDLTRALKIGFDLNKLKYLIDNRLYKNISIGHIDYVTTYGKKAERYFVNVADVGLGAETVKLINFSPKLISGNMKFIVSAMQVFMTFKYPYVKVIADTVQWQGRITIVAVANSQFFAGGLGIAPGISVFEPMFKLVLVEDIPMSEFVKNIPNLRKAKVLDHPKVHYFVAKSLIIEPLEERPVYLEADGEFLGVTPARFKIIPNKLKFLTDYQGA